MDSYIKNIPTFISVLAAFSFGMSVSYDYGYFWGLGLDLQAWPFTIGDHVRNGVYYAPLALSYIVVTILIPRALIMLKPNLENLVYKHEIKKDKVRIFSALWVLKKFNDSINLESKKIDNRFIVYFLITFMIILSFIVYSVHINSMDNFISSISTLIIFVFSVLIICGNFSVRKRLFYSTVMISIFVILISFVVGYNISESIEYEESGIQIQTSIKDDITKRNLLMTLDRGVFYIDVDGQVGFLNWSRIELLQTKRSQRGIPLI